MDSRQVVVQRARETFGDRLEDVVHMVRQDRQGLRGWEEPAHVRAVTRRAIQENAAGPGGTVTATAPEVEFGRGAAEPDRGQQREAMGQLLEAGANALEKLARNPNPDLNAEEFLGLECVYLLYGRPAVLVSDGHLGSVPPFWNVLEDQREDIEMAARGVGRIELYGHPEFDWAGTGFLVNEGTLLTTRRTAEIFAEQRGDGCQFRPGITAWMDYRSTFQRVSSAGYRVCSVIGVHPTYDLAFLEVEPPQVNGEAPTPLALAAQAPPQFVGRLAYLVGYPVYDSRRNEPERVRRIFRDVFNVKRVQPGQLRGSFTFRDVQLLQHDCGPLGRTAGSCLIDLETQQVIGIQLASRYLDAGTAVPLWIFRDDALFKKAGVTFAEATANELGTLTNQLERLARSRYWNDVRQTIDQLYRRAFGNTPPGVGR
jgi:Trypsin-like peptidase domain